MASTKNGLKMKNMSGFECPECGSQAATKQMYKELRECGHTLEVKEIRICRLCADEFTVTMSLGQYKQRSDRDNETLNSTLESLIDFVMFCIVVTTVLIMVIGVVGIITIIGGAI
jgi:hypothetical protein